MQECRFWTQNARYYAVFRVCGGELSALSFQPSACFLADVGEEQGPGAREPKDPMTNLFLNHSGI